jgi:PAS domain S-box-containing protein
MEWIYLAYVLVVGISIATLLFLAGIAWLRRAVPGTAPFVLAMLTIAETSSMYLLFSVTLNPEIAFVWTRLRFIGLAFTPVLYVIFIMRFTGKQDWVSGKKLAGLCLIPLLTQLVVWFVPNSFFFKHWELVRIGAISLEDLQFTGWFWVHFLYSYTILLGAMGWLVYYALRVNSALARSALWISIGMLVGMLGAVPGLILGPKPGLKFTPIGLGLMGLATMLALVRYRLFDIIPIAYDAIFKGIRDAVIVIDDHNKIVQVNPVAETLLRPQWPTLIGRDIYTILDLDRDQAPPDHRQMECPIIRDEKTFVFDVHISPLYQRDHFVGRLIVLYDITERKQAEVALTETLIQLGRSNEDLSQEILKREQAETRFENLLEIAPNAILISDQAGSIILLNAQAEQIFGWERQDLIGQSLEVLLPDDLRERHQRHRETYAGDSRKRQMGVGLDLRARRKDGTAFPVDISLSPLRTNQGLLVMSIVQDITERQQAAQTLVQRNRALQALHETATELGVELNMAALFQRIVERAVSLLDVQHGAVYLYDRDTTVLNLTAGTGLYQNSIGATRPFTEGLVGEVFQTAQHRIVRDPPSLVGQSLAERVSTILAVPLLMQERGVGVLVLAANSEQKLLTEADVQVAQMFAAYAGIAIQNAQLYEQAKQLAALEERQRLARDLHDAVSQTLFSASVVAETLPLLIDTDLEEVRQGLPKLEKLTKGALAEMRTLLIELRPEALMGASLEVLLNQLLTSVQIRTKAAIRLTFNADTDPRPDAKIGLYRIAQEALNNAIKHARATQISVTVEGDADSIHLRIEDNGRGFDLETAAANHFGLSIMRERAATAGIALSIASSSQQGTHVDARWTRK